jgi:hypothetical protein
MKPNHKAALLVERHAKEFHFKHPRVKRQRCEECAFRPNTVCNTSTISLLEVFAPTVEPVFTCHVEPHIGKPCVGGLILREFATPEEAQALHTELIFARLEEQKALLARKS